MTEAPRIQLHHLFARGGMADLFEGELNGRRVLVKTVRSDAEGDDRRRMAAALQDEREGLSRLDHPGVPAVQFGWTDDSGIPFIVFDYVEGIDISRVLASGERVPDPELVEIADQVLGILEAVHRPGLVHRDISPENILLGADGRVRLVDFGLSADVQGTTGDLGPQKGKKRYAAPEQWRGLAPDPRADFYALARSLRSVRGGERSWAFTWWLRRGGDPLGGSSAQGRGDLATWLAGPAAEAAGKLAAVVLPSRLRGPWMLDTLKKLDAERMDALLEAAPRKVREELYRRLGIKAKSATFSLKSKGAAKGGRVLELLTAGKDPGTEVLDELARSYLFGRRKLLGDALDHLKIRHNDGLTDQDLDFLASLEPKKAKALKAALKDHDPVDVELYLELMRVPHQPA